MSKTKNQSTKIENINNDLLSKFDNLFSKRSKLIFVASLFLTVLFVLLLFDPKVSAGGDDSAYLIRSFRLIKDFTFPSFQGPLYPIFLSPFIAIFGVSIKPLKILSLVFLLVHLIIFRKTFKDKIPSSVLGITMILLSISAGYLYFGYQTYVEAFFLMIQSISIWYFVTRFIDSKNESFSIKSDYKKYLTLGVLILIMGLTRSVAYAMLGVVFLYFMIEKKWHSLIPTFASFGFFYFIYSLLKRIIWGVSGADFSGQGGGLLYKNYYNQAEGKEDLAGFFQRLIDNSNLYLSKHLYIFLGIREYEPGMKIIPWVTILTYVLFAVALILVIKRNKYVLFAALYVGALSFITFIIIQKSWDQARLVIPYFPMIMLTLFSGIYYLLKFKKIKSLQVILPIIFVIILFNSFTNTMDQVEENKKNKKPYYGLTPDWINYTNISKWAAKNIPEDKNIASRKPSISFIYSEGRDFVGLYKFKTYSSTEIFNNLEDSAYIILSYQNVYNQKVPNNIQGYLRTITSFVLNNNGNLVGVMKPQKENYKEITQVLDNLSIDYSTTPKQYIIDNKISSSNNYTVSPDSLLNTLKRKDIDYIIKGSLRVNPYQKTGRTINTVHRYIFFIEQKYPGIFEKVKQVGNENNEPAELYKIRYEQYGITK